METNFSKIKATGKLLSSKQISCEELTKQYLASIEKENQVLNAYVKVTEEQALATAKKVDEKIMRGESLLPLEGIPMSLKDNISTKGIETTCCSKILQGYTPIYNATVWDLLQNQNAVLLGKTNMDEFAMGSSSETLAVLLILIIPITLLAAVPAVLLLPSAEILLYLVWVLTQAVLFASLQVFAVLLA